MDKKHMIYMLIFFVASMILLIIFVPNKSNPNLVNEANDQIVFGFRRLYDAYDDEMYEFSSVTIYKYNGETFVVIAYDVISDDPLILEDLYIKIIGDPPSYYFKATEDLVRNIYRVEQFNQAQENYSSKYDLTPDEIEMYRSIYG